MKLLRSLFYAIWGQNTNDSHKMISLEVAVEMRPPSYELHILGVKKHNCGTFIVCLVFYGRFYCPSAMGTVVSA